MSRIPRLSVAEQTAEHLREGFRKGRWSGTLPGVLRLVAELDVSPPTLRAALRILEAEGLLVSHGKGRSRTIAKVAATRHALRVGILIHDVPMVAMAQDGLIHQIKHELEAVGYVVFFTRKSQIELGHDLQRIKAMIAKTPADAWIVGAGSHEVLEWFSGQAVPCLAIYGRTGDLPLARTGPDKAPAYQAATRQLIELGHRRIALITRSTRRKPGPGRVERAFLHELVAHGIPTGDFNLPDWKETPEGLTALLENLFRVTPPTALIIEEEARLLATMAFLLRKGIKVPEQVSLVSTDDESLTWCHPGFAHMTWDNALIVRRAVRWVAAVGRGCADRKIINFPAEFVPGGSIGPAPVGR
ncbi:MAG: substrate-binding domain-containing protein [Akkermansiaceae bacterium]|nr:substrate-binding domain-containing protein [Akkermansiaceae bacterium]